MLVEGTVVVEFKSKEAVHPVDYAQLLSHLRLLKMPLGLLINFHVTILKNGITRMVNDYREEPDVKLDSCLSDLCGISLRSLRFSAINPSLIIPARPCQGLQTTSAAKSDKLFCIMQV